MARKSVLRERMYDGLHQGSLQTHKRIHPDTELGLAAGTAVPSAAQAQRQGKKRKHYLASCYPAGTFIGAICISLVVVLFLPSYRAVHESYSPLSKIYVYLERAAAANRNPAVNLFHAHCRPTPKCRPQIRQSVRS